MKKILLLATILLVFLASTVLAQMTVNLAWDPSASGVVVEYRIYRSEVTGNTATPWSLIATTSASVTTFTDTLSDVHKSYSWVVTAADSEGQESFPSNPVVKLKDKPGKPENARR